MGDGKLSLENLEIKATGTVVKKSTITLEDLDSNTLSIGDLKKSNKAVFNASMAADALDDDGTPDGGATKNTTTGITGMSGVQRILPIDRKIIDNKFELSGFTVQYEIGGEVTSVEAHFYYDTIQEAMNSISGDIYQLNINGDLVDSKITMGGPIICINEIQKKQYLGEIWK